MRLASTWYQVGLAGVTLFAACAPEDRSPTSNEPQSSLPISQPAASMNAGTLLLQESFEDTAFAARGWYDNSSMATTTAEHAAGSTRALEVRFLAGATTPTWGGAARHLFPATSTLDVSYWVKYSPNWVGSGQAYHPHEFLVLSDQDGDFDGPSSNWLTAYIEQNYQNGGIPRLALQDNKAINTSFGTPPLDLIHLTEDRSTGGCNGVVEPAMFSECFDMPPWYNDKQLSAAGVAFQPSAGPGYKGDWNQVEVYFQLNSVVGGIGQPDGVMQYWFNGTLVIDRHDILFRTGARPTIQFHQFLIAPYIGDGSPVDQSMWVDNLTLATGRTAGASSAPGVAAARVASIGVSPSGTSVAVGGTAQFTATLQDAAGNVLTGVPVTWASSNPLVASVSGSGLATAIAAGATTISATSDAITGTATLSVPTPVATVTVAPATVSQGAGTTRQLVATLKDAGGTVLTGRTVAWTSSAPAIATVNASGLETSVTPGNATITASSEGQSGTAAITVTVAKPSTVTGLSVAAVTNTSVTLAFTEVNDGTGQPASYDLRSAISPMSWGSAAGVTQGTCHVPVAGTAIGAARTCTVLGLAPSTSYQFQLVPFRGTLNVSAVFGALSNVAGGTTAATAGAPVASVTLSPASASLVVGATQQVVATLEDASGNTLSGRVVTWASSSPAVATVSGSGLVTGVGVGTVTVTATSEGQSGTAAVTITNAPVASVSVSPANTSLLVGATQQLAATLEDASGNTLSGRVVTWVSNSPAVASVSASGLVTGVGAGTATITATSEGKSGTATVTITNAPVASVTLSPASASLVVGATQQVVATLEDASGNTLSSRVVTWASSSPAVATVSGSGLVTGVGAGTATITATSEGQSGTAAVTITNAPVASVSVSPANTSLLVGAAQQLAATLEDASGNTLSGRVVTWVSNSPAVASVSASGLVTGVGAGSGTVTAMSEGQSGTASVTVTIAPVASVTLSPASVGLLIGATQQLTATLKDASGNTLSGRIVTWASSSSTVATASGSGLVTGVAAGTATVTATSEGRSGTATVTVTATVTNPGTVTNVAVAGVTNTSVTLSFTEVNDGTGQPASYDIRWAAGTMSWGPAASVAQGTCQIPVAGTAIGAAHSCTVLGLAPSTSYQFQLIAFRGTLNVSAVFGALSNVASGTTAAALPVPVASVSVSPASASVPAGQTVQLTATPRDASGAALAGRVVTWGSSNTAVATVSGSGLVTGVAAGVATITATSEGQSGASALTVTPAPVPVASVSVSPASASLPTGQTVQLTATPRDASGNALVGRVVTWGSSNTAVATVSGSGLVTGVAAGSATITATSEGKGGTAAITVTLAPVASVSVSPTSATVGTGQTVQLTATPRDASGNVLVGRVVTWASSNVAVGTVGGSGLVAGVAAGSETTTATSEGKNGTAAITVTTGAPGTEPVFNPAADVSLFYDDFEAYNATAELTTGAKAKYWLQNGSVSLMTSAGSDFAGGAKFTRFDYSAGGSYANEIYTNQHHSPLLNTASTVILTYGFRNTGTRYDEKMMILRNVAGDQRFVQLGGWNLITPQTLQNCWYTGSYPYNPLSANVQPRGNTTSWSRDGADHYGGPAPHFLAGNIGYPTAAFPLNDGNWHRFTYRFTKENAGGGTGNIEGWLDGVKFMELLGGVSGRCEYGQVYTWNNSYTIWDGDLYFIGTTSGGAGWAGGAVLDMDGLRVWLP